MSEEFPADSFASAPAELVELPTTTLTLPAELAVPVLITTAPELPFTDVPEPNVIPPLFPVPAPGADDNEITPLEPGLAPELMVTLPKPLSPVPQDNSTLPPFPRYPLPPSKRISPPRDLLPEVSHESPAIKSISPPLPELLDPTVTPIEPPIPLLDTPEENRMDPVLSEDDPVRTSI